MVGLKCLGTPWRVTKEDVEEFVKDHKFHAGSVVLGIGEDGRKNGMACVLMDSEDVATEAAEALFKQYIGERWIRTFPMSYKQYQTFNT